MKTVVFGDIHGRTCWKDIIDREHPDKVVFLGDYVSSHDGFSENDQIVNFEAILELKENTPNDVVLLRGNHDMQHLMGNEDSFECSGFFPIVGSWFQKNYEKIMKNTQWIFIDGIYMFSHAGISETWFNDVPVEKYEDINKLPPSELFGFRPSSIWDMYGDTKTQGLTWIRPEVLARDTIVGYTQFVGHTVVDKIVDIQQSVRQKQHIILCDCLPRQYVVITNGKFKIVANENNAKPKRDSDNSGKDKHGQKS